MKNLFTLILFCLLSHWSYCQESKMDAKYFGNPIMVDSSNTLLIPILYNIDFNNSNKIGVFSDHYANILVSKADSTAGQLLFKEEVFIVPLKLNQDQFYYSKFGTYKSMQSFSSNWIFYLVKDSDYNENGKIDRKDPTKLYITDLNGKGLKQITANNEHVIDYAVYEKQELVILKIKKLDPLSSAQDRRKKDFYYLFLNHATMAEIKTEMINN